ncbi:MAG TPA: hypothetical protein VIU15_10385, partial [Streptomyces sp.]
MPGALSIVPLGIILPDPGRPAGRETGPPSRGGTLRMGEKVVAGAFDLSDRQHYRDKLRQCL